MYVQTVGKGLKSALRSQECSYLRAPARTAVQWSPSKSRSEYGRPVHSSQFGLSQSGAKLAPLQAAAAAPKPLAVSPPALLEVRPSAGLSPSTDAANVLGALPPAILQGGQPSVATLQQQEAISHTHQLPDGAVLELVEMRPTGSSLTRLSPPPLLFVHGASHAAWCWTEHFFPWLAQHGHHCFAVSLRGSGKSSDESKSCQNKYAQTSADIAHVIASLPQPPVLVAHSMGGLFAQRYLIDLASQQTVPAVAGVVMMASASLQACMPDMNWWRSQRSFMHAVKVFWWMLTSQTFTSAKADKDMLFSPDVPDHLMQRYHHMLRSGRQGLPATFKELQAFMPQAEACTDACKRLPLPIAVMLAGSDTLIMPHQIHASAKYFGVEPITLPGLAHDVMLDTRWERAAEALDSWLQNNVSATSVEQQPIEQLQS